MIIHSFHSFASTMAVIVCFGFFDDHVHRFGMSASQETSELFSCYQGNIQSNTNGQIPLGSEQQLSRLPCGAPTSTPAQSTASSTVPTIPTVPTQSHTAAALTTTTTTMPIQPTTLPPVKGSAPRRRRDVTSYMCSVFKSFPSGSKLTANVTWTANFSCIPSVTCPEKMYCCRTSNCNSLSFFRKVSHTVIAPVSTCLVGSKNSTASHVVVQNCVGVSHYCFNRTKNGATLFGCSVAETESLCLNTSGGASTCLKDKVGNSNVCCCARDNCNGPPRKPLVYPTHLVPTTVPYLVTASKTSSDWMLVLFIAAGVLIGGLVSVVVMVLCRRWKKKRTNNGPLNISYSRVSADFANEDDDNIFSY